MTNDQILKPKYQPTVFCCHLNLCKEKRRGQDFFFSFELKQQKMILADNGGFQLEFVSILRNI